MRCRGQRNTIVSRPDRRKTAVIRRRRETAAIHGAGVSRASASSPPARCGRRDARVSRRARLADDGRGCRASCSSHRNYGVGPEAPAARAPGRLDAGSRISARGLGRAARLQVADHMFRARSGRARQVPHTSGGNHSDQAESFPDAYASICFGLCAVRRGKRPALAARIAPASKRDAISDEPGGTAEAARRTRTAPGPRSTVPESGWWRTQKSDHPARRTG